MKQPFSFSAKRVLLTGATGGLGSALAYLLAQQGARLALSARSPKALKELKSNLPPEANAQAFAVDLAQAGQARSLAERVLETLGYVDVIINNAGIGYFALMEEATEENLRRLFEVNTFAPMTLINTLLPQMKQRGQGRIVNIVSCAGRVPIPTVGVYGGSKSALAVMTHTMALELEPFGIDVLNVYPGTIDNAFEENALREEERSGLCPRDHCGLPRTQMAHQVFEAMAGPAGEAWLERPGRWLSAAAILWPTYVKRKLAPIRDKVVATRSVRERRWRLLQIESALACNLHCVMCPWQGASSKLPAKGLMTTEIWSAIKPHLSQTRAVDFTGGGEPLLQPHLETWIQDAKTAGCEAGFLSNGTLLTRERAKGLLASGVDWICISMDGANAEIYEQIRRGSDFDKVCRNLRSLSGLRTAKHPKLMINFVLMTLNVHQIEDMVHLAVELGIDQINFKQCDVIRGDHGKGFGLFGRQSTPAIARLEKSLAKARRLARKLGVLTTAFAFTPTEQPVCEQDPRNSMFIRYNGTVAPCINLAIGGPTTFLGDEVKMPTVHYGQLPRDDLSTLWEAVECKFYRNRFTKRVNAYDEKLVDGFVKGSGGRDRSLENARRAMPEAPQGCQVCHYLYDI